MGKIFANLFYILLFILSCSLYTKNYNINEPLYVHNTQATVGIYIESGFKKKELSSIYYAINIWNTSANGNVSFFVTPKKDVNYNSSCHISMVIKPALSTHPNVIAHDKKQKNGKRTLGFATYKKCKSSTIHLVVDRLKYPKKLVLVTLHEIFHGIGGKHRNYKESILYPIYDKNNKSVNNLTYVFNKKDMVYFCELYNCNYKSTKYYYLD